LGAEQDGEILREPRNILAAKLCRAVTAITCYEVGTRAFTLIATGVDHHCKEGILRVYERAQSRSKNDV
jgi:hypothetical protein